MLRQKLNEEQWKAKREAVLRDYQLKDEKGKYVYKIAELVKKYGYNSNNSIYYLVHRYGGNR